jgi:hypothetical protein
LSGSLITSSVNAINPVSELRPDLPSPSVPKWVGFVEYLGAGAPEFVNVVDIDSDGDLDPIGAGAANPSLSLSNPHANPAIAAAVLAPYQAGVITGPLFEGVYIVSSPATFTTLSFVVGTSQVFIDPTGGTTGLSVENVTHIGTPITFGVPEPSTYALAGLGLVGLVVAMRRKTAK